MAWYKMLALANLTTASGRAVAAGQTFTVPTTTERDALIGANTARLLTGTTTPLRPSEQALATLAEGLGVNTTGMTAAQIVTNIVDRVRSPLPIRARVAGGVALGVIEEVIAARAALIATVAGNLAVASTAGVVTVTVSVNGALVLTISFAVAATAPTLTWAAGTSASVPVNAVVRVEVTGAGTGASGLRLTLDA